MADMMVKSGIELTVPAAKKHLVAARKAAECLTTDNAAVIVEVSADDPKMVITMFPMKRARPTDVVDRIMRTMAMDMEDYSDQWVAFPKTLKIVYGDANYLSFYSTEASYTGGAHGMTGNTVGTICRKTGKLLTLDDVFPVAERPALTRQLHQLVVEAIGEKNILNDVQPVENFYRAGDGWHFVYNPYEIAAYAKGVIEVVLKQEMPAPTRAVRPVMGALRR